MTVYTRLERLGQMLDGVECGAYLSAAPADIGYFTGSEERTGLLIYAPGHTPTVIAPQSAADHIRDTVAVEVNVRAYGVGATPAALMEEVVAGLKVQGSVATGVLSTEMAQVLGERCPTVVLKAHAEIGPTLRRAKEPHEMNLLRQAAVIADAATAAAMLAIGVGATELEAATALESMARQMGCTGTIYGTQVKGGLRAAYPDAMASTRRFAPGELGYIDLAIFYQGYLGDMTRAFTLGEISTECRHLLETVDAVQTMARDMLRPGVACRDLYRAIRDALAEAGYPDAPPHHLGHGVGMAAEQPRLTIDSDDILQVGDVFSVEPGAYVRGVGGVRIEDVVVLGENGVEVLSRHPRITEIPA